ncbi:nucleoside triphosphate pyrophosphatase [Synechocystis sp. LKSZ1]|uniref:Maf family protein n=1 Tax=Synechocystis sp. LKSZ1 TaxID=3144951 RepID=UPI00336BDCEF
MSVPLFVLASASPARKRLLESVGIQPLVKPSFFDETLVVAEDTISLVEGLALAKAKTVAPDFPQALVLGCDSLLVVEGQAYGKPTDAATAVARWQTMRGKIGELYTGHALIDVEQDKTICRTGLTHVHFAPVEDAIIQAYVASGEPLQCAGAFALEGKGGALIERIEGCHSNVIGLSLPLLRQMLENLGYSIADFWPC